MKNLMFMVLVAGAMTACFGQGKKPASPRETVSSGDVSVSYGRPSKKGRVIFGGLEKFGSVWRTGANEGTEVTFKKDVSFGGTAVKAGTYTLFTIPNENEWSVMLNSELKQWGAYEYEKIKDKNVAVVKVTPKKLDQVVEQLTITPSASALTISWDQTEVAVPLKF